MTISKTTTHDPTMETKLMRTFPFASLLSATALAVTLGACQTASNAPNGLLTAASPLKTDVKNETLDNLVIPETFKTASASHLYRKDVNTDTITIYNYTNNTIVGAPRIDNKTYEKYGGDQPVGISENVLITRNPRDATFDVVIAGQDQISASRRYQDSSHRTTAATINAASANGEKVSLFTVPDSANFEYYRTFDRKTFSGDDRIEFYDQILFFERPGKTTKYVTWAAYWDGTNIQDTDGSAYVKNDADGNTLERGTRSIATNTDLYIRTAAVFGINTKSKDVPKIGSATYTGSLFANTIAGATLDTILGTAKTDVDFVSDKLKFTLQGNFNLAGLSFAATGSGKIERPDTPNTALNPTAVQPLSSFRGKIDTLNIGGTAFRFESITTAPGTFQASSVEGGFFGPSAAEVGGAFRIVGGAPDARLDILGAFTGKKN
jgi:C-lobe and N-lobe beta barrels of Tf-binding protein B